jgi:hypothetical protein
MLMSMLFGFSKYRHRLINPFPPFRFTIIGIPANRKTISSVFATRLIPSADNILAEDVVVDPIAGLRRQPQ